MKKEKTYSDDEVQKILSKSLRLQEESIVLSKLAKNDREKLQADN